MRQWQLDTARGLQESGLSTWSSETSTLSAASAAQPQALSTWTSATSALSAASSAQSHASSTQSHASSAQSQASSALAPSVGSSHAGSTQHGPGKAQKPDAAVPAKVEERVKLVPMLHPDQRQHKEARLQVWHICKFCQKRTSGIHRVRLAHFVHPKLVTYCCWV